MRPFHRDVAPQVHVPNVTHLICYSEQGLCSNSALFWAPENFAPLCWGPLRMQGTGSISAHLRAPKKAGVR